MSNYTILYNPLAGNGNGYKTAKHLKRVLRGNTLSFCDFTKIVDYDDFFANLSPEEKLIVCGGDGTLNRFVNYSHGVDIPNDVFYCPGGSGNDFMKDLSVPDTKDPICINEQVAHVPHVIVKGKKYFFLNGVGIGIDGYCCEEGEKERGRSTKPINYTKICIKALLFSYKPKNAVVTVDGETYTYKNVWIAATMNGRYFGGGLMPTPNQDRLNPEHKVSIMVIHNAGKMVLAPLFPKLSTGAHVNYTKYVDIHEGHNITVIYDAPAPVQIDGEVIPGVSEYTVISE